MNKYMQGPWTVLKFPGEKFVEIRANEGYSIVAHVFFNHGNQDDTARLIAAAPDLVEALNGYMSAVDQMNEAMDDGINVHGAISELMGWADRAKSAIAKATGK